MIHSLTSLHLLKVSGNSLLEGIEWNRMCYALLSFRWKLVACDGGKYSLVLICCRCICEVTADTAWTTSRTNENMRRRQLDPSQNFTAGMPAKLNSSQLRRHSGDKDWDDQCCRPLLFSYRNSIPGNTGGHVAGTSAAYENQA